MVVQSLNSKNQGRKMEPAKINIVCPSPSPGHCYIDVENRPTDEVSPQNVFLAHSNTKKPKVTVEEMLRPLQRTRHVFIKEYAKTLQFSCRATNKFQIFNSGGDCIYFVVENTSIFTRLFCRGVCPFNLKVLSLKGEEVMRIQGQPGCCASVIVLDHRKQPYGIVRQKNELCTPKYSLNNYDDLEILTLEGPEGANCCCSWANCGNVDFDIKLTDSQSRTSIGRISKEWDMIMEDLCGARFPMKTDIRIKALLVGAVFLLNFNFYEAREGSCCLNRCCFTFFVLVAFVGFLLLIAR